MLKDFIREEIKKALDNYQEISIYTCTCDLAWVLFECENVTGSYTCNTYKSIQWIKQYFDEIGDVVKEITNDFGAEYVPNAFLEPEKFQVVIILNAANSLLAQCDFIKENWDNEIELNETNISLLKQQLDEL